MAYKFRVSADYAAYEVVTPWGVVRVSREEYIKRAPLGVSDAEGRELLDELALEKLREG